MSQLNCPVCNKEYIEGESDFCQCFWLLTPYPRNPAKTGELDKMEEERLNWEEKKLKSEIEFRKWVIQSISGFKKKESSLKQEIAILKEQNQSPQIQLSLETYLQDICVSIKQISEKLPYDYFAKLDKLEGEQDARSRYTNNEELVNTDNNLSLNEDEKINNLVAIYNENPEFSDKIEVSETQASKDQRWFGRTSSSVFERNNKDRGEYWIIDNKYLVPKPKQKINENSYQSLETFFKCPDYEQGSRNHITLIAPAKVVLIEGKEEWQLEETGIIEF